MVLPLEIEGGLGQDAGGSVHDAAFVDVVMGGIGAVGVLLHVIVGQRLPHHGGRGAEGGGIQMDHAVGVRLIPGIADLVQRAVVIHDVKELHALRLQFEDIGTGIHLRPVVPVRLLADVFVAGLGQVFFRRARIVAGGDQRPHAGGIRQILVHQDIHGPVNDLVDLRVGHDAQQQGDEIRQPLLVVVQQRGEHIAVQRAVVIQQAEFVDIAQDGGAVGGGDDIHHAVDVLGEVKALVLVQLHQRVFQ